MVIIIIIIIIGQPRATDHCTALQSQKAVTAYLKSKQLLPFDFERHHRHHVSGVAIKNIDETQYQHMPPGIHISVVKNAVLLTLTHCCA